MSIANSSQQLHAFSVVQDLALVLLSVVFLPFSLLLTFIARLGVYLGFNKVQKAQPAIYNGKQVRVLVTGVSMAKGLFLARTMYIGGCIVVGADFEKNSIPAAGRYSQACSSFYSLKSPRGKHGKNVFFNQMLGIVRREQIDVWISCSGVATAIEDAQLMQFLAKNTTCQCFQFNEQATFSLDDKFQFMQTTNDLGLQTPQWFSLNSKDSVDAALQAATTEDNKQSKHKYILKNVAMDDKTRGSLPLLHSEQPKQMKQILDSLDVETSKWIMQQFITGEEEYCTQAVVVDGEIRAFLSCPSESVLMHYKQVDTGSALDNVMLKFTQEYAAGLMKKYGQFTGHLSFDFLALEKDTNQGLAKTLLPIECNPRCHTATVRFRGEERKLAEAYLSTLPGFVSHDIVRPTESQKSTTYFWIAHDLVTLYVLPILNFLIGKTSLFQVLSQHLDFWQLILVGKDPTFEWWDPLPWLILNHVYWPCRFLDVALNNVRWTQVNVSTGKIFEA